MMSRPLHHDAIALYTTTQIRFRRTIVRVVLFLAAGFVDRVVDAGRLEPPDTVRADDRFLAATLADVLRATAFFAVLRVADVRFVAARFAAVRFVAARFALAVRFTAAVCFLVA